MKKTKFFYGWVIVLACMLLAAASTGILSYFGALFVEPVTASLGLGRTEFTMYTTFATVTSMLIMPVIGDLYQRFPPKALILTGALCGACSMLLFAAASTLPFFYGGAVLAGICISFCGGMPVAILLNNWFHEKRGLVTGIAFMGTGLFSAVFSPVISRVIVVWGWRRAYFVLACAILAILVPTTLFLIRMQPSEMGISPYGKAADVREEQAEAVGFTRREAFRMPSFWLFAFALFLVGIITFGTQQHLVAYWTESGPGAEGAARAYSAVMLTAGIAKIGVGALFDRFSVGKTSLFCGLVALGAMAGLPFFRDGWSILLPALLFGATVPLQVMLPTYLTSKLFGQRDYGALYGLFSSLLFWGAGVGAPLNALIYDRTGGYEAVWFLFSLLSIAMTAAMILSDLLSRKAFYEKFGKERKR